MTQPIDPVPGRDTYPDSRPAAPGVTREALALSRGR
jgi:hypothetical protein